MDDMEFISLHENWDAPFLDKISWAYQHNRNEMFYLLRNRSLGNIWT
jgi:hypothetical protein